MVVGFFVMLGTDYTEFLNVYLFIYSVPGQS